MIPGRSARPRIPRPSATGCSEALFGSGADAGELETDLDPKRAHGEAAGRKAAEPLGQAGFSLVSTLKEDEPWLRHIAVPAG